MSEYVLQAEKINKSFSGVQVLKEVDFSVKQGEIHGLMGENGAGKSTLIKIITGVYCKDSGRIIVNGEEKIINSRQDAIDCGISVIYQELSLIPTLTVMQNIFLGQEPNNHGVLGKKKMQSDVNHLIEKCGFELKPDDIVEKLSIAKRQTVEILKALHQNAKIIIMDEPTASLSAEESETLFGIIEKLREQGTSIIYISHRLEEVYRIVDRLTVLRDGEVKGVLEKNDISGQKVVQLMLGKSITEEKGDTHVVKDKASVLEVKKLTRRGIWYNISFSAYGGQILGIGGLVGSGRTEMLRSIFGADHYDSGEILLNGESVAHSVRKNMTAGFGYIPEDRKTEGFIPRMSVADNIALPNYDHISNALGFVYHDKEKSLGSETIQMVDIRPNNPKMMVQNLSGGNQQKVVVGKWLNRQLKVLLVDEPTVGVDVGVKNDIYNIFYRLADQGVIVIVVSSDIKELVTVSDRILVFYKGSIYKEFKRDEATQEKVLLAASGMEVKEDNNEN